MEKKEEKAKLDEDRHSRDIFSYGKETMLRLAKMKVLIIGMRGLGVETAKNIILTGPEEVAIYDPQMVKMNDLGSNFYLSREDVDKKNRDDACVEKLQKLNLSVHVYVLKLEGKLEDPNYFQKNIEQIIKFDVVVITQFYPMTLITAIDKACRFPKDGYTTEEFNSLKNGITPLKEAKTKLIYGICFGLAGYIFTDFGPLHEILDEKEEEPEIYVVKSIEKSQQGLVTIDTIQNTHSLKIGNDCIVKFKDVEGMTEINDKEFQIEYNNYESFYIGDTSNFSDYTKGGVIYEIRKPKKKTYCEYYLRSVFISDPNNPVKCFDGKKQGRNELLYIALNAIHQYYCENNFSLPELNNMDQAKIIVEKAKQIYDNAKSSNIYVYEKIQEFDENVVINVARWARANIAPVCAFFGGIIAQEIIKATGKFIPIDQWIMCDFFETVQNLGDNIDRTLRNCRYDDQIAIFGNDIQDKMKKSNICMVGAGATGCEFLKNFAMMGLCTDKSSKFTVTDNDHIEVSNLSRQFLFNHDNVGKPKSVVAVDSVQKMNPNFVAEGLQVKVCPETENIFDEKFWNKQNFIVYAVDSVEARKYIDSKVVLHHKIAVDSGTKGTTAKSQIIIPHKTLTYNDIPQGGKILTLPQCTLRHFPSLIEHCIEWSKDNFYAYFGNIISEVKLFFSNYEVFKEKLLRRGGPVIQLEQLIELKTYIDIITKRDIKLACEYGIKCYTANFDHGIKQLLDCYPPDCKDKSGKPFWSGSRKIPHPIEFNPEEDLCLEYVAKFILILNNVLGMPFTKEEISKEFIKKICLTIKPPPYVKKDITIQIDDDEKSKQEKKKDILEEEKKENEKKNQEARKIISDIYLELDKIKREQYDSNKINQEIFEKDHDENGHIDFINSGANLRARNYKIDECDRNKTKLIAGNIIPTILTTTAVIAGQTSIQFYTMFQTDDPTYYRQAIINIRNTTIVFLSPSPPISREKKDKKLKSSSGEVLYIPQGWNDWDQIEIKGSKTCEELIKILKEMFNINVGAILSGKTPIYDNILPKAKKNIDKKIEEAFQIMTNTKINENQNCFILRVSAKVSEATIEGKTYKNVSAIIPNIKYIFR